MPLILEVPRYRCCGCDAECLTEQNASLISPLTGSEAAPDAGEMSAKLTEGGARPHTPTPARLPQPEEGKNGDDDDDGADQPDDLIHEDAPEERAARRP